MEPVGLVLLALAVLLGGEAWGWWLIQWLRSLIEEGGDEASLLLIHQQIDQFCGQFSQALDSNTQLAQQQFGQKLLSANADQGELFEKPASKSGPG